MAPACRASAARGAIHDARPAPSRNRVATAAQPSTHSATSQSVLVARGPGGAPPPALSAIASTCRLTTTTVSALSALSAVAARQLHFGTTSRATGSATIAASAAVQTKCRTAAEARRNPATAAKAAARMMLPLQALCASNSTHVMI
jgi:hypothetical protein